jgi:hypothetical protein
LVESFMGADWWHDSAPFPRWPTADRFAPWAAVWQAWETMQSVHALQRLNLMQAYRVAQFADAAAYKHERQSLVVAAYDPPAPPSNGHGRA